MSRYIHIHLLVRNTEMEAMIGKLIESFQGKQDSMGGEGLKQILAGTLQGDHSKEEENPQLKEILNNPLEAMEKNEKLRNAVAAQGKKMGWDILPKANTNETTSRDYVSKCPTTDLGEIKLNEKIKIHQSGDTTDTINIMMFGRSGCGQTTLLSYLTENNQLIGTDSMSTQQFSAETFQLSSDTGMTKIRINESPGMCSGFEIKELQQHWNHLISRVNKEGGVSVFLLLIKSNERITSQFIDEIEEFSELYFDEREELWKRTVVVFTSIDELKGCSSLEDRVNKLETQIAKPGMEKVKKLLDQASNTCVYVGSMDNPDKQRFIKDLTRKISSITPENNLLTQSLTNLEPVVRSHNPNNPLNGHDEIPTVPRPPHVISNPQLPLENPDCEISPLSTEKCKFSETFNSITVTEPMSVYATESLDHTISTSNPDETDFLQSLSHEQLLLLTQDMCKDRKIRKRARKTHDALFPITRVSSPKPKKRKFLGLF